MLKYREDCDKMYLSLRAGLFRKKPHSIFFLKHILFVFRPIKWRCYMKQIFLSVFIMALLVLVVMKKKTICQKKCQVILNFMRFGVQSKNEINTFDNIVIKDLIAEGTASTEISFTKEEMKKIYQKMREINIMEPKELIPEKINCMQTPYGEDKWKIKLNGETQTLYWNDEYLETNG